MPKISGNLLAWRESNAQGTLIWLYDLADLGTSTQPKLIFGPQPPVGEMGLGDQYLTWSVNQPNGYDVYAYKPATGQSSSVTQTSGVHDRMPSTSGPSDRLSFERHRLAALSHRRNQQRYQ